MIVKRTCKYYAKGGNSNRRRNGELGKRIGCTYMQVLIFVFWGIMKIKYILVVDNVLPSLYKLRM